VPRELDEILARMLAREREDRFASLEAVAEELGHYLDSVSRDGSVVTVAAIVKQLAGATIEEQRRSGGSSPGSFHVELRKPPVAELEIPIDVVTRAAPAEGRPASKRGALVGALAVVVLALGGLGLWRSGAFDPPPAPVAPPVVEAPPPPPAPPAPPAPGRLTLRSEPPGARVVRAGNTIATTPIEALELPPDVDHALVVELAYYEPTTLNVRLRPGELRSLELALPHVEAPAAPVVAARPTPARPPRPVATVAPDAPGLLTLDTTPWTKVSLGGVPIGSTPIFKRPTPAGRHTLRLQNESAGVDATREIELRPGELAKLRFELAPR